MYEYIENEKRWVTKHHQLHPLSIHLRQITEQQPLSTVDFNMQWNGCPKKWHSSWLFSFSSKYNVYNLHTVYYDNKLWIHLPKQATVVHEPVDEITNATSIICMDGVYVWNLSWIHNKQ